MLFHSHFIPIRPISMLNGIPPPHLLSYVECLQAAAALLNTGSGPYISDVLRITLFLQTYGPGVLNICRSSSLRPDLHVIPTSWLLPLFCWIRRSFLSSFWLAALIDITVIKIKVSTVDLKALYTVMYLCLPVSSLFFLEN